MTDQMALEGILRESSVLFDAIRALAGLPLPGLYLAAGCVAQTAWNALYGLDPMHGIDDLDIIYYDASDLSEAAEAQAETLVRASLDGLHLPCRLDVKNEARVHLWYTAKFGYPITPYVDTEDAIDSFPTTATAVGLRLTPSGLHIYAPYGLKDMLSGTVRANQRQITKDIFDCKVQKWLSKWPNLKIKPWDFDFFS